MSIDRVKRIEVLTREDFERAVVETEISAFLYTLEFTHDYAWADPAAGAEYEAKHSAILAECRTYAEWSERIGELEKSKPQMNPADRFYMVARRERWQNMIHIIIDRDLYNKMSLAWSKSKHGRLVGAKSPKIVAFALGMTEAEYKALVARRKQHVADENEKGERAGVRMTGLKYIDQLRHYLPEIALLPEFFRDKTAQAEFVAVGAILDKIKNAIAASKD